MVIDLSQTLEEGIPLAHVLPPIKMSPVLSREKGDPVNCYAMVLSEHTGTHFDVPRHVDSSGATLDDYEPTSLCGPLVRIDVLKRPRGLEIDRNLIEKVLPAKAACKGAVVLLNTGQSKLWKNTPEGEAYLKNRPYLSTEAAQYLVDQGAKAVGVDVGGPDQIGSDLPVHKLLLKQGVFIIESLCNLDHVPETGYLFMAFPLKIGKGSGSPIRALAVAPQFLKELIRQVELA
jgi:arylformamidase